MRNTSVTSRERLAERLISFRNTNGISREELALRCGISARQLADIETQKSNTTLDTLDRLSRGIGIESADLIK